MILIRVKRRGGIELRNHEVIRMVVEKKLQVLVNIGSENQQTNRNERKIRK